MVTLSKILFVEWCKTTIVHSNKAGEGWFTTLIARKTWDTNIIGNLSNNFTKWM